MTEKLGNPFKISELVDTVNEALDDLTDKQDVLISGTNIKTVNGNSLLGSGDISVSADTSDCVKLTGNQTITGTKTFTSEIIAGNASSSLGSIELYGGNTSYGGNIDFHYGNSTDDYTSRLIERESGQLFIEKELAICGDKYGQLRLIDNSGGYGMIFRNDGANTYIIPTSANDPYGSWNNNAVRFYIRNSDGQPVINGADPVGISAASYNSNGYVKFNHGLIVQWGYIQANNTALTVTLPTAFTTTNYGLCAMSNNGRTAFSDRQTASDFTLNASGGIYTTAFRWLAIGY